MDFTLHVVVSYAHWRWKQCWVVESRDLDMQHLVFWLSALGFAYSNIHITVSFIMCNQIQIFHPLVPLVNIENSNIVRSTQLETQMNYFSSHHVSLTLPVGANTWL